MCKSPPLPNMMPPTGSDPATKVGEIFTSAGLAFNTLGQLTTQLNSSSSKTGGSAANSAGGVSVKWTQEEVDLLHQAVTSFAQDLHQITERIKGRTVQQIKGTLQKKAYDEAGLPQPQASTPQTCAPTSNPALSQGDVTLNALNASEHEVDVEGMGENRTGLNFS
eukprot:snap_masked-scaffold2355_size16609-processed-gene-0.1 protein:Tk01348 transcript:snap_masked-scaffold2355_size16609-processed-gene-0.1-mRNA-1 annotation:"dna-binding protein c17orf49-like protein"